MSTELDQLAEASKTGKQKLVNSLVEKTGRKIGAMERTNRALQATTQQFMSMASRAEQALSDRQSPARILGQSLLGGIGSVGAHQLTLAGYEAIARGKPGEDPGFLERHAGWLCPLMLGVEGAAMLGVGWLTMRGAVSDATEQRKTEADTYLGEVAIVSGVSTAMMGLDDLVTYLRKRNDKA